MMKNKKMIVILMGFVGCLWVIGCKKDSNTENCDQIQIEESDQIRETEAVSVVFPNHYKREEESIKADFEVEIPADFNVESKKESMVRR